MNDEPLRYAEDNSRPEAVRDALRSMRGEGPSDDSRKAALAALGFKPQLAAKPPSRSLPVFLRWALVGLAVGLIAFGLLRVLGG
jgi:hypothetical protein